MHLIGTEILVVTNYLCERVSKRLGDVCTICEREEDVLVSREGNVEQGRGIYSLIRYAHTCVRAVSQDSIGDANV